MGEQGDKGMNMRKLFNELIKDESIHDIPVSHVLRVVTVVFELINSGKFYFDNEIE